MKWPEGQLEKINREASINAKKPKSYLERLYDDFPEDTIIADGNFVFRKEHWRNLSGKKQILVPIRNISGVPMVKEAEEFNNSISAVRGEIERCFLIKNRFKRLKTKVPFKFEWSLLVHVFAAACALQNIAVEMPKVNLNTISKHHFFERVEPDEIEDEVAGDSSLHTLRQKILEKHLQNAQEFAEQNKEKRRKSKKKKFTRKKKESSSSEETDSSSHEDSSSSISNPSDQEIEIVAKASTSSSSQGNALASGDQPLQAIDLRPHPIPNPLAQLSQSKLYKQIETNQCNLEKRTIKTPKRTNL